MTRNYQLPAARTERDSGEAHYAHLARASARKRKTTAATDFTADQKTAIHNHAVATGVATKSKAAAPAAISKHDLDAEYRRGIARGQENERLRVFKVYEAAKLQGGDAAALRMLATTSLDAAAINIQLGGAADAIDWASAHAEVAKDRGL